MLGRGRLAVGARKEPVKKTINMQDKKDLKILASALAILHKKEGQEIIETCHSYADWQRKIMRVYTAVYMK